MTIAAQAMKINLRLVLPPLLVLNALATPANAGRGLGASEQGATVFLVKTVAPSMKLVDAQIRCNDGDILAGLFKINCKTQKILPTNYRLLNKMDYSRSLARRGMQHFLQSGKDRVNYLITPVH